MATPQQTNLIRAKCLLFLLEGNRLVRYLNSPLFAVAVVAATYLAVSFAGTTGLLVPGAYFAALVLSRLLAVIVTAWRRSAVKRSKIVVFRPFSERNAEHLRDHIIPTLCCYGYVVLIADKSFQMASPYWRDNWFVPPTRGGIEPDSFGEFDELPQPSDDWQDKLLPHIKNAAIAILILDFSGISPALNWELQQAGLAGTKLLVIRMPGAPMLSSSELQIEYQQSYRWRRQLLCVAHEHAPSA